MACRRFTDFLQCERGGGTIMGLFWFILLVGICGLSVDITDAYRTQTALQVTADVVAHAAVQDLPDANATVVSALIYAEKNMPFELYGAVLKAADVEIGVWDPGARAFSTGPSPNAVRVTLHRSAANDNPLAVNFLHIIGLRDWNISAQAVAMAGVGRCLQDGFIAAGHIYSGSTNDYLAPICLHGQLGVKIGSANTFESGVGVTMRDLATFEQRQRNDGIEAALAARDYIPPLPAQVPEIYSDLIYGSLALPDYIHFGPVHVRFLPDNPAPNTFYVVEEVINFGSSANLENLMVLSLQEIKLGSNSALSNVFLFSMDKISFGSNNRIGSRTYCDDRDGEVKLFAAGDVKLGVNTEYSGVQIVSSRNVYLGSNLISLRGIAVQAGGDIEWGSAETFGVCGAPTDPNPANMVYIVN